MPNINAFLCGGAGFIGGHLAARLLAESAVGRVVVYDNFSSGERRLLSGSLTSPKFTLIEGDIRDANLLRRSMEGADVVYHLAANPDIARAAREPDIDFHAGTALTQLVLEAMRLNRVSKILFTSGSGVYGEDASMEFPEDHGPLLPISPYGASKLACEAMICAYCHMFGLTGRVFRFANVVGPRQTHGVGRDFLHRLAQDSSRLVVLGDGRQSKSYIHIDDVLDAMHFVDARTNARYCVHNVATGDYVTVREIAEMAVLVSGLHPSSVRLEYTGGDRGWKGDVPVIRFNLGRISSLGWKARWTSREAVRMALTAMHEEMMSAP
jgi:UDP-glucose 4-epimerase